MILTTMDHKSLVVWWIMSLSCLTVMPLLKAQVQQCPTTGCGCPGRCCLSVVENSEQGTPIGIVSNNVDFDLQSATNLLYSFTSSGSQFNVNSDTGEISTAVEFDRETTENNCVSFGIKVINNDNGATNVLSFAMEILDVNDNPPRFSRDNFTISIDETPMGQQLSCPGGPQAILAAIDPDSGQNGTVTYSIETGSGDEVFEVPNPSNPCVRNIVDLDRDTPPSSYSLVLIARDNGTPSLTSSTMVTFILNDINDNPPMFDSSVINITWPENNISQTGVIYQFEANDIDEEGSMNIEYSLSYDQNQITPFEINSTSGELKLTMPLNAELTSEYTLIVNVSDTGGLTGSIAVTITVEDVNENKSVTVVIPGGGELMENELSEESVVIQFDDIEATSVNQNNYVVILSGAEFFNVTTNIFGDSFSFEIFQSTPVDRERNASVDLVIQVVQGGNPTFTSNYSYSYTITDKNDNAPYMPRSSYSREESEHGPDIFLNLCEEAMDDDDDVNGEVVAYELLSVVGSSGNDITPDFMRASINQRNSHCILYAPAIDREKVGAILTVTLTLRDGGTPQMSSNVNFVVNISDVNDNRPKFPPTVYMFNVTENVPNAVVGFVEATDLDDASNGKVSYFLQSDSNTLFSINSSTGEIRTNSPLDREATESFVIYINVSDNGTPPLYSTTLAEVRISVTDENDNIPTFANPSILVDISSDKNVGGVVETVMAIDFDSPPNDQILYRLEYFSNYFNVDEMGGEIRVTQQLPSEEATYHLVISAYNQEFFEQRNIINVTITVSVSQQLSIAIIGGVSGCVVLLVILIAIVAVVLVGIVCYRRHSNDPAMEEHVYDQIDEQMLNHALLQDTQLTNNVSYSSKVPLNYLVPQQQQRLNGSHAMQSSWPRETAV